MDVLLSAVASDLIGRLISFLISKYQQPAAAAADGARLQRALLRARVILEEAEGRQVTSLAVLRQLRQLRWEMCQSAYALDALMIRAAAAASCRRRRRRRRCQPLLLSLGGDGDVATVVESLEAALGGAKELVVLLAGCPRLTRHPYDAYLFMERCMFGRQVEKEQVVDFLLRPACSSAGDPNPGVLPVVGGREVGKRTLVEHVCIDERVRQHFAKIHRLSSDDLTAAGDEDEYRRFGIDPSSRCLVVVDLVGNVDEEPWRRLCASVRRDSKVIVICRTAEHVARLGTAPRPVAIDRLRRPELWYFFRALAFGAADPEYLPAEMVAIAAKLFERNRDFAVFTSLNTLAALLRADMALHSWRRLARVLGESANLRLLSDAAHGGRRERYGEKEDLYICRPSMDAPHCLFYDRRKMPTPTPAGGGGERLPTVTMQDLLTGRVVPGVDAVRFDVLVWQSPIPPYCSYVRTCEMDRDRHVVVVAAASGGKRLEKRRQRATLDQEWNKKKREARWMNES
uniref:Disease resistance N-terminal domain-containing protein n=1 Tax=Oryza glumipatula TaxID=40148 RepID=A0A0D9Y678_9ORYZ